MNSIIPLAIVCIVAIYATYRTLLELKGGGGAIVPFPPYYFVDVVNPAAILAICWANNLFQGLGTALTCAVVAILLATMAVGTVGTWKSYRKHFNLD